ncbi:hypothetical protein A3K55_00100 [Candidatus Shapirobacteria bacterium RBG_13_44_7]|uniref:Uncharacterized protein n=1 Tax=Candidatus Shapirobacteria bacterium RBG_13_44_7 TaxID=1802149 RepID=A0A1F7SG44_9BACT|nr:MAG: hypothetical protein A3K55_00100 [Candidatus Shapirobacteria bacterium RBG_13_44_7]
MKIALVHDYLKEYGGAESVLEALSDIFPNAPIYTTLYHPQNFGPHRSRLEKKWSPRLHQSFFQHLPLAPKLISPLRLLSPLAFKSFDFRGFDLIITSATGAYFPNSLNKNGAKLICYCHTPPRYLYGLPTARRFTNNPIIHFFVSIINHFLRPLDFKYSQNVDQYLANSLTTAARIKKFYRRDSLIINPPVDIPKEAKIAISSPKSSPQYYLTGGRLAAAKRYDIAIEACNQLKLPLKVFGRDFANTLSYLKSFAGPTIEFVGEVTQAEKFKLFSQAKAYIFPSDQEDFGIVSVEAQASGCPVVGYNSGGITETVIDGQTGVLFDKLTPASCAQAIQKLQKLKITPLTCIKNAHQFSSEIFLQKIQNLVTRSL